jgi:hypothetical protein
MGLTRDRVSTEEEVTESLKSHNGLSCEIPASRDDTHGFIHEPDLVNHPPHYNNGPKCECGRTIECIDISRHHSFSIGNALKYLWRCDFKGNAITDLKKALWYIQDEIKQRSK